MEAAFNTSEFRLRLAVVARDMAAMRAGPGGVLWRNGQEQAAYPEHFVLQLPPKLRPALVEDRIPRRDYC